MDFTNHASDLLIKYFSSKNRKSSIVQALKGLITTDISAIKMTGKIISAVSIFSYTSDQIRIPADETYVNKTINSQAVLVPDMDENIKILHDFIY